MRFGVGKHRLRELLVSVPVEKAFTGRTKARSSPILPTPGANQNDEDQGQSD